MTADNLPAAARDYLAKVTTSRALYRAMFQEAIGLLRPVSSVSGEPERLESFRAAGSFARELAVGTSTARGDLQRLLNFGWITLGAKPTPRLLGHREGIAIYLIADAQAHAATGADRLVSRVVLAGLGVDSSVAVMADPSRQALSRETPADVGRGPARRWRPN